MESFTRRPRAAAQQDALVELLLRIAEGNREAFTEFYHRTSPRVFSVARRIIIDFDLSRDTTQEIYLLLWQEAHKYDPCVGTPMAWLMTITHRRAVDKVRSQQSSLDRQRHWSMASRVTAYDEVAETVIDRLEAQAVVECLGSLSPLQREAIDLAYYRCLTYREVAEQLAVPLPTVKARIRDGLRRLKSGLEAL